MAAAVGSPDDVRNLSNMCSVCRVAPRFSAASLGKSKFGLRACHGMDGKGNQAWAPNLTDDIWLHGWGEAAITAMINNGKVNQMPPAGRQVDRSADQRCWPRMFGVVKQQGAVM